MNDEDFEKMWRFTFGVEGQIRFSPNENDTRNAQLTAMAMAYHEAERRHIPCAVVIHIDLH